MVKGKQPARSAVDDFTNLLRTFNSSNKIQLNVISIISETMCSRADEIACLIMKAYEQNAELGTVIDQLSVRSSLYKQLFEKHARQKVQGGKASSSFALEMSEMYCDKNEGGRVVGSRENMPGFSGVPRAEIGESTLLSPGGKQPGERKNPRRRATSAAEGGAKKRSGRANRINAENAASAYRVGEAERTDEKMLVKTHNLGDQEIRSKGAAFSDGNIGQIREINATMEKVDTGYEDADTKRMKTTTHSLLDRIELLVIRGLEVRGATQTINTQLLDETLFKTIQCKICGLRYSPDEKEVLSLHLADHQRRIRASETKAVVSRDYMCRKSEWLVSKLNLPLIRADRKAITSSKPQTCKICRNKICLSWCDDTEQWILEDAVEISGRQYCHRKCVE